MQEIEQSDPWMIASRLIEQHGDRLGDFLYERFKVLHQLGEHENLRHWWKVLDCVQQLRDLPDDISKLQ